MNKRYATVRMLLLIGSLSSLTTGSVVAQENQITAVTAPASTMEPELRRSIMP